MGVGGGWGGCKLLSREPILVTARTKKASSTQHVIREERPPLALSLNLHSTLNDSS